MLLDPLPEEVEIDGKSYFIDADYRTGILFEKLLKEKRDSESIVFDIIDLYYPDEQPTNLNAAVQNVLDLYRCGTPAKAAKPMQKNGNMELKQRQIYDYDVDAPYIYGAFLSEYGIDLVDVEFLHWWKFQAMFRSLGKQHKIVEIMGYRSTDLSKIKNKHERKRIASLQRFYAIPDNLSFEDKVARAGAAFGGAF